MITDGCIISAGRAGREAASCRPGVFVGPNAVIRESVILTDTSIDAGARVERAIVDKSVRIGRRARIGKAARGRRPPTGSASRRSARTPRSPTASPSRRGAVVHTDVTADHFKSAPEAKPAAPRSGLRQPSAAGAAGPCNLLMKQGASR